MSRPTADPDARPAAVVVEGLMRRFGEIEAVRGIDFQVKSGEIFGFLGPNGAGKSTTIKILCTLLDPSGGRASVAGYDVVAERDEVRRHIGLVFQDTTLDDYLSAEQNLRFHAELYGVPRAAIAPRLRQVMELVGLWERRSSVVGTFSGGMKRRLEIARGLMHAPRVLFLDEPTIGLDPQTRSSIWTLHPRAQGSARTSRSFSPPTTWTRPSTAIASRSSTPASSSRSDTPEALKARVGKDRVQIRTADDAAAIAALARAFRRRRRQCTTVRSRSRSPHGEQFVPRLFAELGVPIRSISVARPSLDDVFMSFTGSTIRDAEATAHRSHARCAPCARESRERGGQPIASIAVPPRTFRNELRAIKIVWHRDMIRFLRDKPRIIASLLQPMLYLFVLGSGLGVGGAARERRRPAHVHVPGRDGDGGAVHLLLLRRLDGVGSRVRLHARDAGRAGPSQRDPDRQVLRRRDRRHRSRAWSMFAVGRVGRCALFAVADDRRLRRARAAVVRDHGDRR